MVCFEFCLSLLLTLVTACQDNAVEGIKYLVADFSLSCFDYSHVVSLVSSICALGLLGMGLPAFIFFKTRKVVDADSKFHFFCGKHLLRCLFRVDLCIFSGVQFAKLCVVGSCNFMPKASLTVHSCFGVRLICARCSFSWAFLSVVTAVF
jgi:hypothetical protein